MEWLLRWWQLIAGVGTVLGGGCFLHFRVFDYLHQLIISRVEKEDFEKEISRVDRRVDIVEKNVKSIDDKILLLVGQNGEIKATLVDLKEAYVRGDEHLKELLLMQRNIVRRNDGRNGE